MGKWAILLVLVLEPMAPAQTRVTVSQLDQVLASLPHKSDGKTAHKIAGYELTERVSSAKLAEWTNRLQGKLTSESLTALADDSAFLDLPASELPNKASPDVGTKNQIFARVVDYVVKTVPKLPNFSALRTTMYFEASSLRELRRMHPQVYLDFNFAASGHNLGPADPTGATDRQLLFAGQWSQTVTYRNGLEVDDKSQPKGSGMRAPPAGLTTKGEFGPILFVVTRDLVLSNHISWSGWENGSSGPLAVFNYEVTKEHSHYAVGPLNHGPVDFPAYHGQIAADPETGIILRITVVADRQPTNIDPSFLSAILVEYGPVTIGRNSYICPVRAVALSKESSLESAAMVKNLGPASQMIFVNDVSFTEYHVFRAESRVLTGSDVLQ